jgi:predicted nucleotidyltransferase
MDAYAGRLLENHPEIEEIVVFGSFMKGNYAPGSDLDLFILLAGSTRSIRDRIPDLLPGAFPVPVDLFPLTREEAAERASSSMMREIQRSTWRYRRI